MKIAEALSRRADAQKRLEQLKVRLKNNARSQEGEEPVEDPAGLLVEFDAVADELRRLIARINLGNAAARVGVETMTEALARRDVLKLRHAAYVTLAQAASVTQTVSTKSEVRFRPTVSVPGIQRTADAIARDLRELDARIQEANWQLELHDATDLV